MEVTFIYSRVIIGIGVIMSVLDLFRKNPVSKLKLGDLQAEEIKLKNQINRLNKEINQLEKKKKDKFQDGIGADLIKKKMLAQEIKQIDMEEKLKYSNFVGLHKQFMFITNLVIIKKYEKNLQKTKIWDKITSIAPEKFEDALIKVNLSGKNFEAVLDDLNRIYENDISEFDITADDAERQLLDTWASVESGSLDVDVATKAISMEKQLEDKSS
jgi:hypothetical protein